MPWSALIPIGVDLLGNMFGGGSSGSSGSGGQANTRLYIPTGEGGADQGWQQDQQIDQTQLNNFWGSVDPAMSSAFQQLQGINPNGYLNASNMAGQQYGGLSQLAGQYGGQEYGQYQNNAGQQQRLQGAGAQTYGTNQGLINSLNGQGSGFYDQMQGIGQQSGAAGQGINSYLGGLGQSLNGQGQAYQQQMNQLAGGVQQAGQAAYQAAFDPQQALYNQQLQQTTDQSNAVNSMYGLGSSGAGAGMTSQAQNNFNLGWQNQQIGRELQGVNAMTSANSAAGALQSQGLQGLQNITSLQGNLGEQGFQGLESGLGQQGQLAASGLSGSQYGTQLAGNLNNQGLSSYTSALQGAGQLGNYGSADLQQGLGFYGQQPGYTQQSGSVPYQAQLSAFGQGFNNVSQYEQAMQGALSPYQSMQNADTTYMGLGNTAQYNAGQLGLSQGNAFNQQIGQLGNALGNVNWGQLSNMFGGSPNLTNLTNGYGVDPSTYGGGGGDYTYGP